MSDNRVTVTFRISGAHGEVLRAAEYLEGGEVNVRPPNIPTSVGPDAWWARSLTLENQDSTEPAISEMLDALDSMQSRLSEATASESLGVELDCTVELDEEPVLLELSATTVTRIAKLRAAFAFDIYDYRE